MNGDLRAAASGLRPEIGYRDLLRPLPSILKWTHSETDFYRRANDTHLAAVKLCSQALGGRGSGFRSALAAMPLETRHRIEFAPQVYRLLSSARFLSRQDVCEALERFCAVEQYIEGSRSIAPEPNPCWSALGDVCVNGGENESIPDTAWSRRRVGALTFAPVVRRTVIDGHSPFLAEVFHEEPVEPHRAGEFRDVVTRVSSAFEFIESACKPACDMLDACLSVVAVARSGQGPARRRSFSRREIRGLAAFSNLHSRRWSSEGVVDGLLHEGIHALLFRTTLSGLFFRSSPASHEIRVVSPWSGQRIELGAFTHACFVWFGLWNFWEQAGPPNERGRRLADRARKGFEAGPILDHIPPEGLAILEPEVIDVIQSVAAEVNAAVRAR